MSYQEECLGNRFVLLNRLNYFLLLLLIFVPPFFRGLFFPDDQWSYMLLLIPSFIVAIVFNPDSNSDFELMDYLMLALPLAYLISTISPAYFYLAANETFKYFAMFFIYYLVSRLIRGDRELHTLICLLYVSGLLVAAAAIPMALKTFNYPGGYVGIFTSFFQYKNTLATFMAAIFFLGLYLWKYDRGRYAWLITIANYIIIFCMRGTSSRGGILVFCAVFAILGFIFYKRRDLSVHINVLLLATVSLFAVPLFLSLANMDKALAASGVFVMSLAVVVLLDFINTKKGLYQITLAGKKVTVFVLVTLIIVMLMLGGSLYDYSYFAGDMVVLSDEIQAGGGTDPVNFWYRFYYDLDALEMAAENPLFGWGGGGWQTAYRTYQDFLYNTKRIHNHYFEVLVETGLAGLVIFVSLWVLFAKKSLELYRREKEITGRKDIIMYVFLSGTTVALHSLMDFSLSFLAMMVYTGTLFGIIRVFSGYRLEGQNRELSVITKACFTVISLLILISVFIQLQASRKIDVAEEYMVDRNFVMAKQSYEEALRLNRWNSTYHLLYAQCLSQLKDQKGAYSQAVKAAEINPYNGLAYFHASRYAIDGGLCSEAVFLGEKALEQAPYQLYWYGNLAKIYYRAGVYYLLEGDSNQAGKYFRLSAGLPSGVQGLINNMPDKYKKMWVKPPDLEIPLEVVLYAGIGNYLTGDRGSAEKMLLQAAAAEKTAVEANLWLAVMNRGDIEGNKAYLTNALKIDGNITGLYNNLVSLAERAGQ